MAEASVVQEYRRRYTPDRRRRHPSVVVFGTLRRTGRFPLAEFQRTIADASESDLEAAPNEPELPFELQNR